MNDDFNINDQAECGKCGHTPIHWKECPNYDCEDGVVDQATIDPKEFNYGDLEVTCIVCKGTCIVVWCPGCGADLTGMEMENKKTEDGNE